MWRENPHGTRVCKSQVLLFKTQVLKTRVLPSNFPSSSPRSTDPTLFFFVLRHCKSSSSDQSSNVQPAFIISLFFDIVDRPLQIEAPAFIRSSTLHIVPFQIEAPSFLFNSSFFVKAFFVFSGTKITRFCFLELKSIRLEIYLAKTNQISQWNSSI